MQIQYISVLLLGLIFPHKSCAQIEKNHLTLSTKKEYQYREKFSDILLVVNFNHPFYSNIEFLKKLYSPIFNNIVFYGEETHPDVCKVNTHTGYFLSAVIQDVYTRFPDYKGYLFLQDDCVLHFWNYVTYDQDKIWYAVQYKEENRCNDVFYSTKDFNGHVLGLEWFHWQQPWAFKAAARAYRNLASQDRKILRKNIGRHNIPTQPCDMFYVPARLKDDFYRLSTIFQNVFCEVAVPTMLCCLDDIKNWEHLNMLWGYDNIPNTDLQTYPIAYSWIHPIKFSNQKNRDIIETIFTHMILEGQNNVE
ncbi:MAG: hypothetical protein WCE21_03960 [Candidatus Babeliales bacterium]